MPTQHYSVTQPPIETLLAKVKLSEMAIPEIQRPFVWSAVKVRNLLDSLYQGYPVGYLITWRNPNVKLKDGSTSFGKHILIDGQQRVIALMAAVLGLEVVDKNYKRIKIRIAFHPIKEQFEVLNTFIEKDASWIPDISVVFDPKTSLFNLVTAYCDKNPGATRDDVFRSIERMKGITSNQIGMIELDSGFDIETVTEIFIRVNSEGVPLSQADFAMSKIAVNETYGGNTLRKAIDYFCHLAVAPEFFNDTQNDKKFAESEFFQQMAWLRNEKEDIYDPSYTDMLRVAFTSEFQRGRLGDLVALLSGRNFETRQYEEVIVEDSFGRLKKGILQFMNETHFKNLIMIIRSAGFVDSSMIRSQNSLNFAYILYLTLRGQGIPPADIERYVRRWFVMSVLTGRYSSSPESAFDYDIRQIHDQGIQAYANGQINGTLSNAFWESALPQNLNTSVASSPYFRLYQAAQIKMNDLGFLSKDITVRELIEVKSDVHHLFPRDYLKKSGLVPGQYNQIANYVVAQSEINIAIGNKEPRVYFSQLLEQCSGGPKLYGNITEMDELKENFRMNCIPEGIETMTVDNYQEFLAERRRLMAQKIRTYFEGL
ncbi:MAG TPA: DUF262 domain-containing protein [Methanothrix sp.]|nr:DUF262 domain-containing protein [Methanothrix sp.]